MVTTVDSHALRADAQRNHDRIIVAAHEAFAGHGYEVSIEEIARRAGVGPATLYRRFPNKEALLRAVVDARIADLEQAIVLAQGAHDPWEGLLAGVRALIEIQAANMVFLQILEDVGVLPVVKDQIRERVFLPLAELFARAQQSAQIRPDLDPAELPLLIGMVAATAKHHDDCDRVVNWDRYLTLLTDALRTPTPTPLPAR
jgi:AcrR family transcriptional regulator